MDYSKQETGLLKKVWAPVLPDTFLFFKKEHFDLTTSNL